MRKLVLMVGLILACVTAFAETLVDGVTGDPVAVLDGPNDFKVLPTVNGVPIATGSNAVWGNLTGTLPAQEDLWTQLTNRYTIAEITSFGFLTPAYSNAMSSLTPGAEGIRKIGALGGYTLEEFIEDTGVRGAARDCPVFAYAGAPATNLSVAWTTGDVYSPVDGYFHPVAGSTVLTDNSVNYGYWSMVSPNTIQWTTTRPAVSNNVVLATFVTAFGMIIEFDPPEPAGEFPLNTRSGAASIAPSLVVDGMSYYAVATNLNAIIMDAGVEYHDMRYRKEHSPQDLRNPAVTIGILAFGHTNVGQWGYMATNQFPVGRWDNGTNVVTGDPANWYKGLFLSLPDSPMMYYVYPQIAYTSAVDAIAGFDPALPPGFTPYVPLCTEYVFKGDDTSLRTDSQYWVDRRFQIRRPGGTVVSSGGAAPTPSLNQVMISGSSLGGILPHDAGKPTDPDQLANKDYVDSSVNNINYGRAYVDRNGDNVTAKIRSSILPFQTIQAAIDAAAAIASDTNRYVVTVSPGIYAEHLVMSNYVGIVGADIESTKVIGTVTYPHAYTDLSGGEISLLTILSSNTPALLVDAGSDNAYIGLRSCYLISLFDNNAPYKSVVDMRRGLAELYATTYCELQVIPTNGSATLSEASIFEHTTDVSNNGLSTFTAFGMSSLTTCTDTNDNVNYMFTHDNLDAKCINTSIGGLWNITLDDSTNHGNHVRVVNHDTVIGRTFSQGTVIRAYLNATNSCNLAFGRAKDGPSENVAIVRGNHFRVIGSGTSNVWFGAAIGTNDGLRVYDSVFINNLPDYPQPRIYTNDGSAGKYFLNTVAENGDHLFGGALDFAILNTPSVTTPQVGHVKFYANPYAGIENLYMKDSSGNIMRDFRDNFYTGYNDDTTNMRVGDPVYISAGLSPNNTPKVKKSMARDPSTMPAIGVVGHFGGIATGRIGRVMIMGRLENYVDTSAFTSGQKLYVGIDGGVTNVAPTGTNISQMIGTCHIASTNGYFNVLIRGPDMLGGMTPSVLNAATVGGLTPEQLIAQQQTYYIWGSLAGAFPSSRLVQLANPSDQPARTNVYNSVTNNMRFSGLCINTNENPRILTKGVVAIHTTTSRTGDSSLRTLKGRVRIFESDASTLVAEYWSTNTSTSVICVTNINENVIFVDIPVDTPISDLNRIIVGDTMSDTGWTGTESIRFLSQDGYLSRLIIPASSAGIYAPLQMVADIQVRTNDWNTASADATYSTNWIATNGLLSAISILNGDTSVWNTAAADATYSTNWIATNGLLSAVAVLNGKTSVWNTASANAIAATNWIATNGLLSAVAVLNGKTGVWDTASSDATAATNWIATNGLLSAVAVLNGKTGVWDTASSDATAATNWIATNGLLSSVGAINARTGVWNTAAVNAIAATNWIATNGLLSAVAGLQGRTGVWNTASVDATYATNWITTNGLFVALNTVQARTGVWNQASADATSATNWIASNNNKVNAAVTNNQTDVTLTGTFSGNGRGLTGLVVTASTPIRFKAAKVGTQIYTNATATKITMTNTVLAVSGGCIYNNATSRWIPNVTNKVIEFHGLMEASGFTGTGDSCELRLYKNGTTYGTVQHWLGGRANGVIGGSWSFVETSNTNATDYYEVFITPTGNNLTAAGAGTNNWWYADCK